MRRHEEASCPWHPLTPQTEETEGCCWDVSLCFSHLLINAALLTSPAEHPERYAWYTYWLGYEFLKWDEKHFPGFEGERWEKTWFVVFSGVLTNIISSNVLQLLRKGSDSRGKGNTSSVIKSLNSLRWPRECNRYGHGDKKVRRQSSRAQNDGSMLLQMPQNHSESSWTIGAEWPLH